MVKFVVNLTWTFEYSIFHNNLFSWWSLFWIFADVTFQIFHSWPQFLFMMKFVLNFCWRGISNIPFVITFLYSWWSLFYILFNMIFQTFSFHHSFLFSMKFVLNFCWYEYHANEHAVSLCTDSIFGRQSTVYSEFCSWGHTPFEGGEFIRLYPTLPLLVKGKCPKFHTPDIYSAQIDVCQCSFGLAKYGSESIIKTS